MADDATTTDATTTTTTEGVDASVDQGGEKLYKEKHVLDLRKEAQRSRERAEKSEADLKTLSEEAAELRRFKEERELADLEAEKKFQEIADKEKKRAAKLEEQLTETKTQHQQVIARERVRAEAIRQGILDEEDVDMFDISSVKYEGGKYAGVKELVASIKEAKPHKFASAEGKRTDSAPLNRPGHGSDGKPIDARQMDAKAFAELDARMKSLKA